MPKHDGFEILAALQDHKTLAGVPMVVLSSSPHSSDPQQMALLRMAHFVTKSPDLDDYVKLGLLLKELLAGRRGHMPAATG